MSLKLMEYSWLWKSIQLCILYEFKCTAEVRGKGNNLIYDDLMYNDQICDDLTYNDLIYDDLIYIGWIVSGH